MSVNDRRLWRQTNHVCSKCLGRVYETTDTADGSKRVQCSNCGIEAEGDHKALCACGMKLRSGKSAGLKCVVNPNRTAEMPSEIVAVSA